MVAVLLVVLKPKEDSGKVDDVSMAVSLLLARSKLPCRLLAVSV